MGVHAICSDVTGVGWVFLHYVLMLLGLGGWVDHMRDSH